MATNQDPEITVEELMKLQSQPQGKENTQSENEGSDGSGKVHTFDCGMPVYSLSFSKKPIIGPDGTDNILMGVGTCLPHDNRI